MNDTINEKRSAWTREHLYLLGIILLLEFIYLHIIYTYGQDINVINLWSFAGTVTSIILAVIAIIYGFVQTISQQSSSEKLAIQIDSLHEVVKNVQGSRADLQTELLQITSVADTLKVISDGVTQSQTQLSTLTDRFDEVAKIRQSAEHRAPKHTQDAREHGAACLDKILSNGTIGILFPTYAIWRLGPKGLKDAEIVSEFLLKATSLKDEKTEINWYRQGMWAGSMFAAVNVLEGLSCLESKPETPNLTENAARVARSYFSDFSSRFGANVSEDAKRLAQLIDAYLAAHP